MSNTVKLYTADETDARYLQHNDTIDGTYVLNNLSLSGTTLTVSMMDPANDWAIEEDTITLPSGGSSLDTYCNSITGTTTGSITYYNTVSGTKTGKRMQLKYSSTRHYSYSVASISTSTTSSSWTKLGSITKSSNYYDRFVEVKFKSSGDYGGVLITTQSSSPSETNSGVKAIMTLPTNRWGTFSVMINDNVTYYIYGMAATNIQVQYRDSYTSTQSCTSTLTTITDSSSSGGGSI